MIFDKFDLTKKTALITGAGGMLGIEHAKALLEIGAKVVLTDISEVSLCSTYDELVKEYDKDKLYVQKCDITQPSELTRIVNNLRDLNIRVDILINNAAIDAKVKKGNNTLETSRLENFEINQWNNELAVGLTGAFLCSQTFGTMMARDGKGGVILNIASDLSVISPDQRLYRRENVQEDLQPVKPVTYSVIKSGLIGLTKYLSTYWAEKGIRCNALSPGGVFAGQDDLFVERLTSLIPLKRMAKRDEYKSAVQFLCSSASEYMTGQNMIIDGGRTVL
jgi:NAD(P)-dependent dehydrogenase (short-subunit alcohol dehydrogenase family)